MDDGLEVKLAYLFNQLAELGEKPFLFIFDDFEWNLEPREGRYILKSEIVPILSALISTIRETGTEHRIIITCRYRFDSELLDFFYEQGLEPLRKAELTKKLSRLEHFNSQEISKDLRERALALADGNPRLLEFLNDEVLGKQNAGTKLTELEQSPELWKDKIIWEELYQFIDEPLQQILSHCLVYEIPVPMIGLDVVCESLPDYKHQLQRGLDLGLIEISSEPKKEDQVYRISQILPHVISSIRLPKEQEVYCLHGKASKYLYQLWGKQDNESKEKWQEMFRLLFADKDNPNRFRQGFHWMIAVQHNAIADQLYESVLRKVATDLVEYDLFTTLENYLKQGEWKSADEETALIFYLIMVKEKYKDWNDLCKKISYEIIKKIDILWLENSGGKFGISIQAKIFQSLKREVKDKGIEDLREKFGRRIGWLTVCWLTWSQLWADSQDEFYQRKRKYEYSYGSLPIISSLPMTQLPENISPVIPALVYTRSGKWNNFGQPGYGSLMAVEWQMNQEWWSLLSRKDL
jgi:hypothetical protein